MDLRIVLILGLLTTPAPSPSPAADPCAAGGRTSLLAAMDRPTIGFSACAVRQGESVVEAGYQNASGAAPGAQYPQALLRVGFAPNWEADVAPAGHGTAQTAYGAKWEASHGAQDALAFDLLSAPGSATINLDYSRTLSAVLGTGVTVGVQRGASVTALLPSAVLTAQFNARSQAYAEAFAQMPSGAHAGSLFGVDAGVQYLIAPSVELDLELGRTATGRAKSAYIGTGFGVRF